MMTVMKYIFLCITLLIYALFALKLLVKFTCWISSLCTKKAKKHKEDEASWFNAIDELKKTDGTEVATKIDELYSDEEWVNERFKNQQLFKRKAHLMEFLADTNKNKDFFDVSAISLCSLFCSTLLSEHILDLFTSEKMEDIAMANSIFCVLVSLVCLIGLMRVFFTLEPTETKEREFSRYELMHIERVFNEHVNGGIKKDSKDVM